MSKTLALSLLCATFVLVGCERAGPVEEAGEAVDEAVDDVRDQAEDIAGEAEDLIDEAGGN